MASRLPQARAPLAPPWRWPLAAPIGQARAEAAPPVAIAAHSEVQGRETRLSFTLQSCVKAEAYRAGQPARAIIDLPEVNFQIDPAAARRPRK